MKAKFKITGALLAAATAGVLIVPQNSDAFPNAALAIQPAAGLTTTALSVFVGCPAGTSDFDLFVRSNQGLITILDRELVTENKSHSLNRTWDSIATHLDPGLDLVARCHVGSSETYLEERILFENGSYHDIGAFTVFEPVIPPTPAPTAIPVPTMIPLPYDETLIWPINQAPARLYHLSKRKEPRWIRRHHHLPW